MLVLKPAADILLPAVEEHHVAKVESIDHVPDVLFDSCIFEFSAEE